MTAGADRGASARTRRIIGAGLLAVTVAAGLAVNAFLPDTAVTDIAGDALYAVAAYLAVVLIAPRLPPLAVAGIAARWCVAVELFQLTGLPLAWGAHATAFADMSQLARNYAMHRAAEEAQRVADAVTSLGRGPAGMDFYRLRRERADLERFLSERLSQNPDLWSLEVRDRFGAPVAEVQSEPASRATETIRYTLMLGGVPQGDVRVGVSTDVIDREIEALRRSLRIKVALLAALGGGHAAQPSFANPTPPAPSPVPHAAPPSAPGSAGPALPAPARARRPRPGA